MYKFESMKKIIATFLLLIQILPAATCRETDKRIVEFADPYILYYDGLYYLYGTKYRDGIGVLVSEDLKTWSTPNGNDKHLALSKEDSFGDHGFWAPEVYATGNGFIMYYTASEHICAATSDSPTGPFIQKRQAPMLEERGIDNHLFIDDDGTPYIFWVRFNRGNEIWMAELEKDCMTLKKSTMTFCFKATQDWEKLLHNINEGPEVIKHDGYYYLIYSGNDYRCQDYAIGYATSTSPFGPWIKFEGNPVLRRPGNLSGTGHNAMFYDGHGHLMTVFHSHQSQEKVDPRQTHVTKAKFKKNSLRNEPDILKFSNNYFSLKKTTK